MFLKKEIIDSIDKKDIVDVIHKNIKILSTLASRENSPDSCLAYSQATINLATTLKLILDNQTKGNNTKGSGKK